MGESLNPQPTSTQKSKFIFLAAIVIIVAALGSGFFLARLSKSSSLTPTNLSNTPAMVKTSTEVGSTNTKVFSDTATGTLQAGGLKNEGTHNLVRVGGPSQTVYMVSSVVDLDQYVGKKVEVWGQTLKARSVPWLMDVGRLKILD